MKKESKSDFANDVEVKGLSSKHIPIKPKFPMKKKKRSFASALKIK